jgi:hypothetical protein
VTPRSNFGQFILLLNLPTQIRLALPSDKFGGNLQALGAGSSKYSNLRKGFPEMLYSDNAC